MKTIVVLPDIRSTHNVGSVFRTGDAVGVDKIYLVGYTPDPLDRFGRERKDIAKVALGAEKKIPWEHFEKFSDLVKEINKDKKIKSFFIAVEQNEKSVDYTLLPEIISKCSKNGVNNLVFVFGNEVEGLSKDIISRCDVCVELPMLGSKESLNISVTAGVVLYKSREQIIDNR